VGFTTFFFIFLPFLYFFTGIIPGRMAFSDFIIQGSFIVIFAGLIYTYAQKFLCHPETERKFHWRGMILKYSCWPVYLLGLILTLADSEIPYVPTAKKAVIGYVSPFVRPLILYCWLFVFTVIAVYIRRRYYTPESELVFSAEKVWGMIGFSFIAFIQSLGGVFAAFGAKRLKQEDPWIKIDVNLIKL
jgi:cellulose synthase (UDP-forming)